MCIRQRHGMHVQYYSVGGRRTILLPVSVARDPSAVGYSYKESDSDSSDRFDRTCSGTCDRSEGHYCGGQDADSSFAYPREDSLQATYCSRPIHTTLSEWHCSYHSSIGHCTGSSPCPNCRLKISWWYSVRACIGR